MQAGDPVPDFPTGGFVYGKSGIRQAYTTGRGSIIMRAKARSRSKHGRSEMIVITEIPYQVNKAKLIERIADLVQRKEDRRHHGFARRKRSRRHARSSSNCKRGEQPEVILNNLYKHTPMQTSRSGSSCWPLSVAAPRC